ncbi:MAG TPA: SAM-dependent methyltransferase [Thermoplasmata archaeon]|nr:SAM-dependent methyltransferase [Thermoplasmata archaeon]
MTIQLDLFVGLLVVIGAVFYFVFASFWWGAGYQPTPRRSVDAMLRLAEVGPSDTVFDLGAGTGAVVFRAAKERGAAVVGVEVEPLRVLILRLRRRMASEAGRIRVIWGNLFGLDFREATVVALFLWPDAMRRLRPLFEQQLRVGARVVSHYHPLPGYRPTAVDSAAKVYLYRWPPVPEAAGRG